MNITLLATALIAGAILLAGIGARLAARHFQTRTRTESAEFWKDLSVELIGAGVTTLLLSVVLGAVQFNEEAAAAAAFERDQAAAAAVALETRRTDLIAQFGSADNGLVLGALVQLRREGWLTDGTLAGVSLLSADLRNADLGGANLAGANLRAADLRGANLFEINLEGADLRYALLDQVNTREFFDIDEARRQGAEVLFTEIAAQPLNVSLLAKIPLYQSYAYATRANLRGADLRQASIVGADLSFSDLNGAVLQSANLSGTNLWLADFTGATLAPGVTSAETGNLLLDQLRGQMMIERLSDFPAVFSRETFLPGGGFWSDRVDWARYTDPTAANFNTGIARCRELAALGEALLEPAQTAPISCVSALNVVIPYPPRLPGPFQG